ncbi:cation:proton antiporter [Deltaproteobacteria bacterium]|nr:cation:proton antiporter [Deltaproteobacteria bacterium]
MSSELIVTLLLILTLSWILGYIFSRFGLPFLLGELLAGVLLGPPILGIISYSPSIELIAEFGIFFVMFHTGMELDPRELLDHVWVSLAVGLGGFIIPFILGFLVTKAFGGTVYQSLFVGMGVSISAIAVQAVILHSMRLNRSAVGHIIIGAAIADNIFTLIALSTLLGMANTGIFHIREIGMILIKVIGFFGITILLGYFVLPRFTRRLTDQGGKALTFALSLALLMAYLAELAGLHLIIGAFLAGQFVRKDVMDEKIYESISDRFFGISYGFLVPIFFASLSFHLHLSLNWSFMSFSLVLILAAVLGKLIGCGLGAAAFRYNLWESTVIGLGMNGRGAVELVIAMVIIQLSDKLITSGVISDPLLTQDQFSGLILMAFVTTIIAPISMRWAFNRTCLPTEKADFCRLWDEGREI